MTFDVSKIKTTVDIEANDVFIGDCGYFSNDIDSLRIAIESEKTNFKTIYSKLQYCLESKYERRFGCSSGNFALFYPLDKVINKNRY